VLQTFVHNLVLGQTDIFCIYKVTDKYCFWPENKNSIFKNFICKFVYFHLFTKQGMPLSVSQT